jgi:hypothetical protein
MFHCPQCSQPVFSAWRKLNASRLFPARCPSCGTHTFVSGWAHAFIAIAVEVAFWGTVVLAIYLHNWFALALFPVAILAISLAVAAAFPFEPIPLSAVASVRRSALIQTVLGFTVLVVLSLCLVSQGRNDG